MKRLISALLVTAMLISALPTLGFAEKENTFTENAVETTAEEMPGLGNEATIGNVVFYIEDGTLLRSENNTRPKTVDEDVSWVVEDNNKFYWSKLEEHSTSSIYFCSTNDTTGEALTKLFVPVEAFDIDGNDLYYLYNGEIVKSNMVSGKEEVVLLDKSIKAFYLNPENMITAFVSESPKHDVFGVDLLYTKEKLTDKTGGDFTNSTIIANKLTELFYLLPYSSYPYFSIYGNKSSSCDWKNKSACRECDSLNVSARHPNLKNLSIKGSSGSYSCYGFAKYAFNYIFGEIPEGIYSYSGIGKRTSELNTKIVASCGMNATVDEYKSVLKQARTGDIIQTKGHTMIYLSCDDNGFYVIQNNESGHDLVTVDYMGFDYFDANAKDAHKSCVIYEYINYDVFAHKCSSEGYETYV